MTNGGEVSDVDEPVTELLRRWTDGDVPAGDRLFAIVYAELREIARRQRRRWHGDDTLDTTALAHEVYLRLRGATDLNAVDRAHFFAVAARASRQILSNYARRRQAERRGGTERQVALHLVDERSSALLVVEPSPLDRMWDLEVALSQLQTLHPRACKVVECRYFGGLSIPDTAVALGISEATVKRDWGLAQAWLHRELRKHAPLHD